MKRLLPYLAPLRARWPQFVTALVCGLLFGAASGLGIPFLIKEIIPAIFERGALGPGELMLYCSLPLMVMSLRAVCGFGNTYLLSICGQDMLEQLRQRLFDKIQALPLAYFQKTTPGELISRAMQDSQLLRDVLIQVSQDILKQPMTLLFAVGYLFYLTVTVKETGYLLLFIASIPLCVAPIRYFGRKVGRKAKAMMNQQGTLTQGITQNLSAIFEIRAFNLEERESLRFRDACREFSRRFLKVVLYSNLLSPAIEIISAVGVGLALYYSYKGSVDQGVFVSLIIALYLCYEPLKKLGRLNTRLNEGMAALERIENVLSEEEPILDPLEPVPLFRATGEVTFDNVSFAYGTSPVLREVSVVIKPGQSVALVGPSGAGKSTFCNLIPRFYDVTGGRVLFDGIDVRDVRSAELRGQISIVPQNPVLFHDTIENNIRVGRMDATDEEVRAAARQAYAEEFILGMEQGYATLVGERGDRLSGGQKQRLALARAFLKDAPLLLLDEATSALDAESEACIQKALEACGREKTVIIIAHRFSSIRHVDRVLVFEAGRIVEQGPPQELLSKRGRYRELFETQTAVAEATTPAG